LGDTTAPPPTPATKSGTINHGQDVGLQTRELWQFAEARGWTAAGEYIDAGVSGAKDSRPELNRLMADAHKRRFDVVCVWRFDRFARSVSHLLRALETFKALGIDFVSFSEQMDTSTFPPVTNAELVSAVRKRASDWPQIVKLAKTCRNPNDEPCSVSDSSLYFRIEKLVGDRWTTVGMVEVLIPMGC